MDSSLLVSFCMSTYKRPEILERQLRNILKQVYKNIEIIVSDNDPDASAQPVAVRINDPRVKYYNNGLNLGMVKSFNQSVARSNGDYIIMVTDDDPVYPGLVSTLMGVRKRHPGYGVYAGCADWIVETDFSAGSLNEKKGLKSTLLTNFSEGDILQIKGSDFAEKYINGDLKKTFILWSCCMMEKQIVNQVGGMPDYGSELLTDHAFIIAGSSIKGMAFINRSLGGQSVRGDNFGYDFERNKAKYQTTPRSFFDYVHPYLQTGDRDEFKKRILWDFIGRAWVEYSLMIFRSLKLKKESTRHFFKSFNQVFSDPGIKKWKYKFYLKAYFNPLFRILIKLRGK